MKPSERIQEIAENLVIEHTKTCTTCNITHHKPTYQQYLQEATFQYLDEEYEKNNSKCFCKKVGCEENCHTYHVKVAE